MSVICRWLGLAVLGSLCICRIAVAQQSLPAIGFLSANSQSSMQPRVLAFERGLRELGYVNGKNIRIEYKFSNLNRDQLESMARELVEMKVKLILAEGPTSTRAALAVTRSIPVVVAQEIG